MHIRTKDNSIVNESSNLIESICDKQINCLDTNNLFIFPTPEGNEYILKKELSNIKTKNYIGYLKQKEDSLTITSRFHNTNNQHTTSKPDYFIMYMLSKVLGIESMPNFSLQKQTKTTIDIGYVLLTHYLLRALRKGIYKRYTYKFYNNLNFKGKLDINQFIKRNTPFQGRIPYRTRELTTDRQLIHLIRHAIEFMTERGYKSWLLANEHRRREIQRIKELSPDYNHAERKSIIEFNENNPIIHAYYHEYRVLQRLCIHILKGLQTDIQTNKICGFLIDVSWLWEEYLATILGNRFIHPDNKKKVNKSYYFVDESNNRFYGEIYPDFISKNVAQRVIVDAKYKLIHRAETADFHQMLAYMLRFRANSSYMIYPTSYNRDIQNLKLLGDSTEDGLNSNNTPITVHKVGMYVNKNCKTYDEFVDTMKEEEKMIMGLNGISKDDSEV